MVQNKTFSDIVKTQKFRSPAHKCLLMLLYSTYHLENHLNKIFKRYNISLTQYNVLRILRGTYPQGMNSKSISERLLNPKGDLSRLIRRLEAKNLIKRTYNKDDKRTFTIFITNKGLQLLKDIDPIEEQIDQLITDAISSEEIEVFNQILEKLAIQLSTKDKAFS